MRIHTKKAEHTDDKEVNVDHLVGPETEKTFAAIARSRARKSVTFVAAPSTAPTLTTLALVLRPSLNFMGYLFQASSTNKLSVLELLKPNAAPHRPICYYMARLLDLDGDFWTLLKGNAWTASATHLALDACLRMCGNLHIKYVTRYEQWPWKLSVLADDASDQTARGLLHAELQQACDDCLDPFAQWVYTSASRDELIGQQGAMRLALKAAFQQCPCTNISSELRLARAQVRRRLNKIHGWDM